VDPAPIRSLPCGPTPSTSTLSFELVDQKNVHCSKYKGQPVSQTSGSDPQPVASTFQGILFRLAHIVLQCILQCHRAPQFFFADFFFSFQPSTSFVFFTVFSSQECHQNGKCCHESYSDDAHGLAQFVKHWMCPGVFHSATKLAGKLLRAVAVLREVMPRCFSILHACHDFATLVSSTDDMPPKAVGGMFAEMQRVIIVM
jgi:hypothetical protein